MALKWPHDPETCERCTAMASSPELIALIRAGVAEAKRGEVEAIDWSAFPPDEDD